MPKGGVEKEETYIQAAEREGFEEAGIKGEVTRELGLFKGVKKDKEYEFWIYSFKVNELVNDNLWLEVDERKREWFTIEQALTLLKYEAMKEALVKFKIISK
ncbi:hypothetical protein K502DRAFT_333904 [Neoconidiobolus thromboides FSU 785]|nr:hypothetical protein K502DRAFT_333904 [Neoconidiobolus thromboides FSU 785]